MGQKIKKLIKKYFEKIETGSFLVAYLLHAMEISTEALGAAFGIAKMPYIKYIISRFIVAL